MPAFRVSGSTGPASTTSFFGAIPDALTFLHPMHQNNSANPTGLWVGTGPTFLVNQFVPFNTSFTGGANAVTCSFGASTTAPDGSSNAVHLTEAATTSPHYVTAGHVTGGGNPERFQVFAKAAERTRVALTLFNPGPGGPGLGNGCKCIFDLVGGQIGVANHLYGSFPDGVPGIATITKWPNGWYLCSIDVTNGTGAGTPNNMILAGVWIDAGSGTGAENTSYAGDGSSGIYVWKAADMAAAAWGFGHNTIFFDDFNSISTIDVGRTNVNGFNWYMGDNWPGSDFNVGQTSGGSITISGSNVLLTGIGAPGPSLIGVHTDGTLTQYPGGYVSGPNNVWQPPIWITNRAAYYNATFLADNAELGIFTVTLEALTNLKQSQGGAFPISEGFKRGEWDTIQIGPGVDTPTGDNSMGIYGPGGPGSAGGFVPAAPGRCGYGYPKWNATFKYTNLYLVNFNGLPYSAINPTNGTGIIGQQPDISPTWWAADPYVSFVGYSPPAFDGSVLNVYDIVWVPSFLNKSGFGHIFFFLNGAYINQMWAGEFVGGDYFYFPFPQIPRLSGARELEKGHHMFWIPGTNVNGIVGCTFDYFRMRK